MDNLTVNIKNGVISANFEAVEASVKEICEQYRNVVVTEETLKDDKKLLAELRKYQKQLDTDRKDIKKAWNEPYNEFERRAKEAIALYDEPINIIGSQIVELENKRKAEKRAECMKIFESVARPIEIDGWLTFEQVEKTEWLNATYSLSKVADDIDQAYKTLEMQYRTIEMIGSKYTTKGLEVLKETHNIQTAIKAIKDAESIEADIQADINKKIDEFDDDSGFIAWDGGEIEEPFEEKSLYKFTLSLTFSEFKEVREMLEHNIIGIEEVC